MGNDFHLKILAEFTSHMCLDIVLLFPWLDHEYWPIWYIKKCIKMLSREYDENCVTNRKIYCDYNIIVRYWFERQLDC